MVEDTWTRFVVGAILLILFGKKIVPGAGVVPLSLFFFFLNPSFASTFQLPLPLWFFLCTGMIGGQTLSCSAVFLRAAHMRYR